MNRNGNGVRTPEDLRLRSRVDFDTGCWHWKQCICKGVPQVVIPIEDRYMHMRGRRAAAYVAGKRLCKGWQAWGTCESEDCVNPDHVKTGPRAMWAAEMKKRGVWKTPAMQASQRAKNLKRRALTPEQVLDILSSEKTGVALAREYGVSQETVSAVRRGKSYRKGSAYSVFSMGALA